MADRLISAEALIREMWRRCGATDIETDKGRAKWDSGLWIRYKVFEECIADAPTIEPKSMQMTNAELFKKIFGIYATELWAKPESEFLEWINSKYCGARMDGGENDI